MSNMSYCRYENTLQDLRDCFGDMQERAETDELEPLSQSEEDAKASLINLCQKIVDLASEEEELDEPSREVLSHEARTVVISELINLALVRSGWSNAQIVKFLQETPLGSIDFQLKVGGQVIGN